MAIIYPSLENIQRLKVPPTPGEWDLVRFLKETLDDTYEVFFTPYLDGDRPDIIILKEHCAAFIIEVKDWDLQSYSVTENNTWEVSDGSRKSRIGSPQSQAFRYKKNLYDLHLPVVGLKRLTNENFFNLVHCFVYFHNAEQDDIELLYEPAEQSLRDQRSQLNESRKNGKMDHGLYERKSDILDRKKWKLQRDKSMSFGLNRQSQLAKRIKAKPSNALFDDSVYRDFKRRLSPPDHTLKQGVPVKLDEKQLSLTKSEPRKGKIKGVAGSGKTTILAQLAVNASKRHGSETLILTFNITLKNYIRDRISDIQGGRDFRAFEISNYHQFFNSQANNAGLNLFALSETYGMEKLYSTDIFNGEDVPKYQTILVDEIQDYESDWVKIVRDNFLGPEGEMILFGDDSQNIYHRDSLSGRVIAQGFGRWEKLLKSYRISQGSPLNQLFRDFQLEFLVESHPDTELFETNPVQTGFGFGQLRYEPVSAENWKNTVFNSISDHIRSHDLHPNDVVILSSRVSPVRQLNELWTVNEKTHCMFETLEEIAMVARRSVDDLRQLDEGSINDLVKQNQDQVERVRRAKKNHFYANSGLLKLSTVFSFKGLESKTVFYLMERQDDPESVYTAITRATENLVVFDLGGENKCSNFLNAALK